MEIIYDFVLNLVNEQISSASSMKQRFFLLIFVTFNFLLFCNLIGMIPYSFTITSHFIITMSLFVATPLWAKCEGEAHTPKSGKLESSGIPENSERECRGQISSHLGALGVIGKVLKCRCPKWPRMSHLDICSPSYGQKKGRESKWQFDSRPLKVGK